MNRNILVPGRNCRGIYRADRTGLLIDGRNYYRAFHDAALQARRYILMAGWQFERSVQLLRGPDATGAGDVTMARFLNRLCDANPDLQVFILMWDFSPLVAFDKEWFNKWILDLTANDRIQFRFDSHHALYASHHQKLVVIDGASAFVGGLDLAANSWDDRQHWAENADRVLASEGFEPYHDVQSFSTGSVAWELTKLFRERWVNAGGDDLLLQPPDREPPRIRKMFPLAATETAISITRGQTLLPVLDPVTEIKQLYIDAIRQAERLIYIENQYFTSQAVYDALRDRLTDTNRRCPEIVLVLPKRFHTLVEDISLSVVQSRMLRSLSDIAARARAPFGVYYTAAALRSEGPEKPTYIHSKVLIVDDRFLTVGSANVTNRSMGMDTELNLSWEAKPSDSELTRSIRRVRANLLAEHTGLRRLSERRALGSTDMLVKYLNEHADTAGCRLRRHTMESFLEDISLIRDLMPGDLSIDPERPIIEEEIYEVISRDRNSIFARGIRFINQLALPSPAKGGESLFSSRGRQTRLDDRGLFLLAVLTIAVLALAMLLWILFFSR